MKCSIAHLSKEQRAALKKKYPGSMTLKNYLLSSKCIHIGHLNSMGSVSTIMFLHALRAWLFLFRRFMVVVAAGYE